MIQQLETVRVPNIGTDDQVEVIEILVAKREKVEKGQSLIVLENDKASMEIPSPLAGEVVDIKVKSGDKVAEGSEIMAMAVSVTPEAQTESQKEKNSELTKIKTETETEKKTLKEQEGVQGQQERTQEKTRGEERGRQQVEQGRQQVKQQKQIEIRVPNLGVDEAVEIIEVHIEKGKQIEKDDTVIVLESDKASMEIPASSAGKVVAVKVQKGDKVKSGDPIALLVAASLPVDSPPASESLPIDPPSPPAKEGDQQADSQAAPMAAPSSLSGSNGNFYAGPAVRKMARELGVELANLNGSGHKGRILKEDIQNYVKRHLQQGAAMPEPPQIDFAAYGKTVEKDLNKIQRLTAENMHRAWITAPHVTQFEEVDITDLENFRKGQKAIAEKKGVKLTPVPFLIKALALALKELPQFNVSVVGNRLVQKLYYHIGMAVATPHGLVVPVIRDVDKKSIWELAQEASELAEKARHRQLSVEAMQGGCITLSSLGAQGGTQFTPIINVPEVAILGVSKSSYQPVYQDGTFVPRLILPIALSYDHRAINGVDGAKFTSYLKLLLSDIRNLAL